MYLSSLIFEIIFKVFNNKTLLNDDYLDGLQLVGICQTGSDQLFAESGDRVSGLTNLLDFIASSEKLKIMFFLRQLVPFGND